MLCQIVRLTVSASGLPVITATTNRALPAGQSLPPLTITVQPDGSVSGGVVVNAETLEPLEDALVSTGISNFFDLTDIDGRFRVENIPPLFGNAPRQIDVRASKSGFITATRTVTIFCGAEVFLEFGSPPGGFAEIFGTITDATTGEPLEGLFVGSAFGEATTTDELGQYRLLTAPLAADGGPRVWQVSATRDLDTQSADVTVQAGTPTRQDFQFASDPVFGIDVGDESSSFDPRTRTGDSHRAQDRPA